ncbi:MAG: hypothetical protein LBT09_14920, partial [Planctomycetaceae bacterium]|nr:hypothetical protein [Planctomycetaceae bacterium]
KSTASRRDAMLVRSMIDVDLPTFRPYGTRCFSWTLSSTNILPLTGQGKDMKFGQFYYALSQTTN